MFREHKLRIDAHVELVRNDAALERLQEAEHVGPDPVELTEEQAETMATLLDFLRAQARYGAEADVWCLRPAWGQLLTVLDETGETLPPRIELPRDG